MKLVRRSLGVIGCLLAAAVLTCGCRLDTATQGEKTGSMSTDAAAPIVSAAPGTEMPSDWRAGQWHIGDLVVRPETLRVGQAAE